MLSPISEFIFIKYNFSISKDVLPEKDLLEKAATLKWFEYLPFGRELKV